MSEETKAFIPNNVGDTLIFNDVTGKKFILVCNYKFVKPTGYSSTGHDNECDDSYMSWDYLQSFFNGDLIYDNGEQINFMLKLNDTPENYDSLLDNTNCTLRSGKTPLYFKFSSSNSAQAMKGFIENNSSSELKNFVFRSIISLNSKQFQNVNIQSVVNPGVETSCPATKNSTIGIDSVYYSAQFGLIRLTTVGGKKYQRAL